MTTSGLRAVCFVAALLFPAGFAHAQLIPIRSLPIAQGDQFQIFPSDNLGIGSVSIALHDSLADPFANPATAARVRAPRVFSAPTVYSLSRGTGGGRSLPFAALLRKATWYGGLAVALQQVEPSKPPDRQVWTPVALTPPVPPPFPGDTFGPVPGPDLRARGNRYLFAMVGKTLSGANDLSVGASALWTDLHMLDGADLLYVDSRRVAQNGEMLDLRLGVLKEWHGDSGSTRSFEALVLHNRYAARHDVTYADAFWDPESQRTFERPRLEQNDDRTRTWGLQLKYVRPLGTSGWQVGWLATANHSLHPKSLNYELVNIAALPADPGRTTAIDLGVGFSRQRGAATFGIDLVYQPIRSYTWIDATEPLPTIGGDTIAAGGEALENRFRFSNALLRIGTGQDIEINGRPRAMGFQFGLILRSTSYRLAQRDNVQLQDRHTRANWLEWTPTWGLTLRLTELELRYRGRVTHGAGRPGRTFVGFLEQPLMRGVTLLAPPNSLLPLTDVTTATHQISLSLPLR